MNSLISHVLTLILLTSFLSCRQAHETRPNVIIIFTDDQGYKDLGCYGSADIATPHLDQMASEGIRFTNFYVSSSICSPSRASLMTGRLPFRNGVKNVFFPDAKGMAAEEVTLAELLQGEGYKTACFGKWHLGDQIETLPLAQGFDEYFGIPYSNDMYIAPHHTFAEDARFLKGYTLEKAKEDQEFVKTHSRKEVFQRGLKEVVPLFEGNEVVEYPAEQASLTQRYVDRTLNFVDQSGNDPFFIYLAPAMPHVPLYASPEYEGKSRRGLYGDVIEEIDANVGRLLAFLKKKKLDKNTLLIFASDNGPWLGKGDQAGTAFPLRDGKFSLYEGGVRVPCIAWWPGKWARGRTSEALISSMDLLPTIAYYAKASLPEAELDGINLATQLEAKESSISRDQIFVSRKDFFAIRKGDWKYLPYGGKRNLSRDSLPELYNLRDDLSEKLNLYHENKEIADELHKLLQALRNDD